LVIEEKFTSIRKSLSSEKDHFDKKDHSKGFFSNNKDTGFRVLRFLHIYSGRLSRKMPEIYLNLVILDGIKGKII